MLVCDTLKDLDKMSLLYFVMKCDLVMFQVFDFKCTNYCAVITGNCLNNFIML